MKALILGAGGQVGRALMASAPAGAEVVALDRDGCDIGDPEAVRRAVAGAAPDLIFNAAAYTAVDKAESEPEAAERINATGAGYVALAARDAGAHLVHLSTDFVFAGDAATPRGPDDETGPQGVYAATKLRGEQAVAHADPGALIVRTAWVYAPKGANFVNTMLRLMGERDEVRVVADQIGTPTWAPSLAETLWRLAGLGATGLHHFTDAGVASWYDFAVAIAEEGAAAGLIPEGRRVVPIATAEYPTSAPRPAYSLLDKKATWALLGGPPPHWRERLRANMKDIADNG
jgi:dTDP-4-dehydrorhamnose reductase